MKKKRHSDFGAEMTKMFPLLLREVTRRQKGVLAKGGLALSHIVVLDVLTEKGPCTMGELAKTLNLTMSAVTGIADRMIKVGLIKRERTTKDRRVVRVILLKKGKNTAKRINKMRVDMTNGLYSSLSEKERREYLRLIKKVYNSLKKE